MDDKNRKIAVDEHGERYVRWVPNAFLQWSQTKSAEEVGRIVHYIAERTEAGDEEALKPFPLLATQEHADAWEDGYSVSNQQQ